MAGIRPDFSGIAFAGKSPGCYVYSQSSYLWRKLPYRTFFPESGYASGRQLDIHHGFAAISVCNFFYFYDYLFLPVQYL